MKSHIYIPKELKKIINDLPYKINYIGMSSSIIIEYSEMILKITPNCEEAINEKNVMEYLNGKIKVPQIIFFKMANKYTYLLMSKVKGLMACDDSYLNDPYNLSKILANVLKTMWEIDVNTCSIKRSLDEILDEAKKRVKAGYGLKEDDLPIVFNEDRFNNFDDLLEWLRKNKPELDKVFTHGDLSLPNIFIEDGELSGLIDLGRGGIADRYQDIAICYRSLKHNYEGYYGYIKKEPFDINYFLNELAIPLDYNKIKYYILLDELF